MSFEDLLATDAALFDDPDSFPGVESVVITFNDSTTRTVDAGVWREDPEVFGDGYRPRLLLSLRNSVTAGILPTEIDGGGVVKVTMAERYGETPKLMTLKRCTDPDKAADAGRVWVEVG